MKKIISFEIELNDEYVKDWEKEQLEYHTKLYGNEEEAKLVLKENPIEKSLAEDIEGFIINECEGMIDSVKYKIEKDESEMD